MTGPAGGVLDLADLVGLLPRWTDAAGRVHEVAQEDLRALLTSIGRPADSESALSMSLEAAHAARRVPPALVTAWCGETARLPIGAPSGRAVFNLEDGSRQAAVIEEDASGLFVRAPAAAGYHTLEAGGALIPMAAAPTVRPEPSRGFGLAAQIYALDERDAARREAFGDFGDVARFAVQAGEKGADALALSPAHALFLAEPGAFSPYAASSRLFLNGLFADAADLPDAPLAQPPPPGALIDWGLAGPARVLRLRAAFEAQSAGRPAARAALDAFRRTAGPDLERHALFEGLDARFRIQGVHGWERWPQAYHDPGSEACRAFAVEAAQELRFHAFVQKLASDARDRAQRAARGAGMRIGLIADLAVGIDRNGSDAWSHRDEIIHGAGVGAPPDLFQAEGQDWGVLGFDPEAMRATGFRLFIATVRANLRGVGGLRIDHAMGLRRLWLVPRGASAVAGAYLSYPEEDLLRLLALEAARAGAILVGEDLGTVPGGFREGLAHAGVLGMSVLWFERDGGRFTAPTRWSQNAVAMTSTHDLATVAGWWRGLDLSWRARRGDPDEMLVAEGEGRGAERAALWDAMVEAGAAAGDPPPETDPAPVVDAALAMISQTPAPLVLAPAEDLLGLEEQVNLPGDVVVHPNWRRRLPGPSSALFEEPPVRRRLADLSVRRRP